MDDSRSGGRRLKDRLARLFCRPANSLLRSSCSSSSSISTALTATTPAATRTSSTSSPSTTTTTGALHLRTEPFSAALDRLRHPSPEPVHCHDRAAQHKDGSSASSRHDSRRRSGNVMVVGRAGARKLASNPYGFTTSDDDEMDDDADVDTATFFSSRSLLSTDSSSSLFYASSKHHTLSKTRSRHCRRPCRRWRRRQAAMSCVDTCGGGESEPGFRPLVVAASAAEEVQRGLAVVKRSRDPYADFRESMVEAIVGRQVFGAAELERLLDSYMALNAPCLHPVILQAFSDIWVVLHAG